MKTVGRGILFAGIGLLCLLLGMTPQSVYAASTSTNPPTTSFSIPAGANTNPSATPFSNPTRAFSSDDNYATGQNGYAEGYGGFGFSIASGSTINGIVFTLEGNKGTCTGTANIDFRVFVTSDGLTFSAPAGGGGSTGTLGSADSTCTFGSSTNLWGLAWTVSQANSTEVQVQAQCSGGGNQNGNVLDLDYLTLTLYYTAPATTTTTGLCASGSDILPSL